MCESYACGNIDLAPAHVLGANFLFSLAAKTKIWHDATETHSATGSLECAVRRRSALLPGCISFTGPCPAGDLLSLRAILASSRDASISWTSKPGTQRAEASKRPMTAKGAQQQRGALLGIIVGTDEISGWSPPAWQRRGWTV